MTSIAYGVSPLKGLNSWQFFLCYWLLLVTIWTLQDGVAQRELNGEQHVRVKKQKKKTKPLNAPVKNNRIDKISKKKKKSKQEKKNKS